MNTLKLQRMYRCVRKEKTVRFLAYHTAVGYDLPFQFALPRPLEVSVPERG
jgi:hypothetical protein